MPQVLTELVAKITTDASGLKSGLSDAEGATEKSSQNMAESLKKVGIAMVAAGAAITAAMGLAAKSAMDAVESENLFNASLGKNAKVVRDWSNTLGKALGLNTYELRKNTGTIYVMVQSMGIAGDAAMDMSEGITELAYDMASFYNISPEEAFGKLKSGLVGMSRPLQDLGILVNETTIKAYALKTGLIEQGQEMTEQQKVTARYGAILEATTVAQGDLARTMDSPTNKLRVLSSTFDELKIVIGENLLPIISSLMTSVGNVLNKVTAWVKENPILAKTLTITAAAVGVVSAAVGGLILLLPSLISGVAAFGVVFHAALGPIGLISLAITALIAGGILLWQNWDKVSHFLSDIWSNIKNAFLHGVDAILGYLNGLIGWLPFFGDKITEARDKISNLIEAEKIRRDAADTRRALEVVNEALEETTEIQEQATDTTAAFTESVAANTEELIVQQGQLESQIVTYEDLLKQFESIEGQVRKTRREFEYQQSEAGRLGITIKDVTNTLFYMGKTNEEITKTLYDLGEEADNVNAYLESVGLTAEQVAASLDVQKGKVNELTAAYQELGNAPSKPGGGGAVATKTYSSAAERLADQYSMSERAAQDTIQRYTENPNSEEFALVKGIMESITGYATGGVVPGPIGMPQLATVHGGEAIIPANESMGGVTVNISGPLFMEREDQMNQLVDKIRKGIQRQDRLRFGGAYSG